MTKEDYFKVCSVCKNHFFEPKEGYLCEYTGKIGDFDNTCNKFRLDKREQRRLNYLNRTQEIDKCKASDSRRIINYIIDKVICSLITFPLYFMFFNQSLDNDQNSLFNFKLFLISITVSFCYYMIFELSFGKTFAKFITKTKVISTTNDRIKFLQIFKRTLLRFIPFEPISFFGQNGWHDIYSETRVIKAPNNK